MRPITVLSEWLSCRLEEVSLRIFDFSKDKNDYFVPGSTYCDPNIFTEPPSLKTYKPVLADMGMHTDAWIVLTAHAEADCMKPYFVLRWMGFQKLSILKGGLEEWKIQKMPRGTKYKKQPVTCDPLVVPNCAKYYLQQTIDEQNIKITGTDGSFQNSILPKDFLIGGGISNEPLVISSIFRQRCGLENLVFAGEQRYYVWFLASLAGIKAAVVW